MSQAITELLEQLRSQQAQFSDVLDFINANYTFTPTAFINGDVKNSAEENQGSCRVFAFAQLNALSQQDTLQLFAEHYQNVVDTPDGDNHQNIRQFMQHGWDGVAINGTPLKSA